MNTTALNNYSTKLSEGYLGAIKATGNKYSLRLSGGDLSKAIKASLQEVLSPDLKKSDVKTRNQSYSGGQNITITLKLDKSIYAPTLAEFTEIDKQRTLSHRYDWIWTSKEGVHVQIFSDQLWSMTSEEQEKAATATAEYHKKYVYDVKETEINQFYIDEEIMLNEKGRQIVKAANQVIKAFRHDDSNSMVDYFDTNFYYSIRIEWKEA